MIDSDVRRYSAYLRDRNKGVKFFHPEMPAASRTSRLVRVLWSHGYPP